MEHISLNLITCWPDLLAGVSTLPQFTSRIESISKQIAQCENDKPNRFLADCDHWNVYSGKVQTSKDKANKFKGDVFEVFCELLIKLSPLDDRIGISEYHPYNPGDPLPSWAVHDPKQDVGVDGYGFAKDGSPTTVQCKYRAWDWDLNQRDHLHNFIASSFVHFGIPKDATGKMLILTTGNSLNWYMAQEQFAGNVRCISHDSSFGCLWKTKKTVEKLFSLRTIVDNHVTFWKIFREKVGL